jgi:PASTA domain-containing protein
MPIRASTPPVSAFEQFDPSSFAVVPPDFELVGSIQNWRANWSLIVTGKWSNSPFSGLLCYERDSGVAAFYDTTGTGGIQLLQEYSDWRQSWTFIVPGVFGDSGYDGLLLYDQQAGFAAFYDTDGKGNLILLHEHSTLGNSGHTWSHIVVAPFNDSRYSGVLLYDQSAGFGAIYATDGHGHLNLLREYSDWRTTWTAIVAGQMSAKHTKNDALFADLFFYEGSTGYGETYATDGKGGMGLLGQQGGFPLNSDVFVGNFGCSVLRIGNNLEWTNLLFFDRTTNVGTIYAFGFTPDMPPPVLVPDVFEMSATAAADLIRTAGLVPKFTGINQTHSWVSKQSPVAGQLATKGSTVTMTLSTGPMP